MKPAPPRRALKFLRWFCREDYIEEIEGDLTELYEKYYLQSPGKAKRKFIWNVVKYFRPEFIKSFKSDNYINPMTMFRHNLLISYRNFRCYKTSFFINLVGLSTGLASALLIYLWVNDELNVDKYNEKDEQLYQVLQKMPEVKGTTTIEYTPGPLASTLAEEMPEVEYAVSLIPSYWFMTKGIVSIDGKRIKASPQFASRDYFNAFTCPVIEGNKLLSDKKEVMISDDLARRLFTTTKSAIGKTIQWEYNQFSGEYFIAGVFAKVPSNSRLKFDILFNYELFLDKRPGTKNWGNSDPCTYVILKKGTNLHRFNEKIVNLKKTKTGNADESTFFAMQYSSKYLYGDYINEDGTPGGGRIVYVNIFSITAIFILIVASINFMNLSTARASRRLKEIGVKKVVGATRRSFIMQHLSEAILLSFLSLIVSLAWVYMLLPSFNSLTEKNLTFYFDWNMILSLVGITVFTGLISGSYPAIYLSGFNPVTVLKGKLVTTFGDLWIRRGLVVFQFTLSVILTISVIVLYQQIEFIQSKNLGFNRDNIIQFELEEKSGRESFLNEARKIPGVVNAAGFYHNLTGNHGGFSGVEWSGKGDQIIDFGNLTVGYDFIKTLGIEITEGSTFSRKLKPEHQIILNEAAIQAMGIKDPVGKTVSFWGEEKRIMGIARNFNFESLYEEIKPCFFLVSEDLPHVIVKIQHGTERNTIERLKKLYTKHNPGFVFDFKFLDTDFQALYAVEQRVNILARYFAGIAILISCLGLLGLAAFTAERRTKEIGIRRILGCSEFMVVHLLSRDFTRMVLMAITIALPIGYFIAGTWLENFAYRIDLKWWYFAGAGALALMITWITVGVQTLRVARINPADCLRNE